MCKWPLTDKATSGIEYRKDDSRFIQLSHRYVRDLSETIDQIGISASWPISKIGSGLAVLTEILNAIEV